MVSGAAERRAVSCACMIRIRPKHSKHAHTHNPGNNLQNQIETSKTSLEPPKTDRQTDRQTQNSNLTATRDPPNPTSQPRYGRKTYTERSTTS